MKKMEEDNKKELVAFRCLECNELLDMGLCGMHRSETGHTEFEPVYR